jgi:hypothetical protein
MLLGWLFERKNHAPIGTFEVHAPAPTTRGPIHTTIHGVIGLALVGGGGWLAFQGTRPLLLLAGVAVYLAFAHYVHPRPNRDNLGWAGSLIDHPLRWSDDHNRMLLFLQIVLYPGRYATTGVRNLARLALTARAPAKPTKGVVWERRDDNRP